MKQKDIAVIVAVAGISLIVAFALANFVFGSPKARKAQVPVLEHISADFPAADNKYFNSNSIDSTQTVKIGANNNPTPFNK